MPVGLSVEFFVILCSDERITLFAFNKASEIKFVLLWLPIVFLSQNFLYIIEKLLDGYPLKCSKFLYI